MKKILISILTLLFLVAAIGWIAINFFPASLKATGNERNAKIIHDVQDYHTSPAEVADLATKAKVKQLVLHHFAPAPDVRVLTNLYKKELKGYDSPIYFANDGDKFVVK